MHGWFVNGTAKGLNSLSPRFYSYALWLAYPDSVVSSSSNSTIGACRVSNPSSKPGFKREGNLLAYIGLDNTLLWSFMCPSTSRGWHNLLGTMPHEMEVTSSNLPLSPLGQNISEEKSTCHGFGALIGTNSGSCFTMLTFIFRAWYWYASDRLTGFREAWPYSMFLTISI